MNMQLKIELARRLHLLGVSKEGVIELLWKYPTAQIEAQLEYLPYRKAKRPEAMIIESIRKNYSPPKEFYYAKAKADLKTAFDSVDEDSEQPTGSASSGPQGHRASMPSDLDSPDVGVAKGAQDDSLNLPDFDGSIR